MIKKDTKQTVLEFLEKNRDKFFSGESIAKEIGISRNAVWKCINDLRNNGYDIEAVTNKGYRISDKSDIISVEGIKPFLKKQALADNIYVFNELPSTNIKAKEYITDSFSHGTVIIAKTQTSGKGRFSRQFFSPANTGVYMSIILNPQKLSFANITTVTAFAANVVCDAIESITGLQPKIKWVNDIYLNDKKVCGILTEASFDLESMTPKAVVVGIGINVYAPQNGFPQEIEKIAGCILPNENLNGVKNKIIAEIVNGLLSNSLYPDESAVFSRYKSRLFILGKNITVIAANERFFAVAKDIDEHGHLIVSKENGDTITISGGEISIKL